MMCAESFNFSPQGMLPQVKVTLDHDKLTREDQPGRRGGGGNHRDSRFCRSGNNHCLQAMPRVSLGFNSEDG